MKIIPQKIKNEAKILIENEFYKKCKDLLGNIMNDLLFDFSTNKCIKFTLNLISSINKIIIDTLSYAIRIVDNLFLNSEERIKYFYINKKNVSRTIVGVWGSISFERTYYTDKNKQNGFYFIDELFGFEKYKTYDQIVRGLLINESVNTNVNKACNNSLNYNFDILNYFSSNALPNIPRQTIYNWIKNWNIPKVNYQPIANKNVLYVMCDEKWIHEQIRKSKLNDEEKSKKHYIMSKCFVIFTGATVKNKRKKLLNKHVFITSSKSPWKDLMDEICKIYDFEKIDTINLLSDAGTWILAGKSELKLYSHNQIIVNTCEFHVKQKINRMTSDEELRKKFCEIIYNDTDKSKFIQLSDDLIEAKPHRKAKLEEYKNYILKHWKSIINMKNCDIKSSMESHISHCVAEQFGSRPKGYSKNKIESYLKLREYKLNGINILDLYLKSSYQDSDFIYNEKEIDFSIFDKSTSLLPVVSSKYSSSLILHNIAF